MALRASKVLMNPCILNRLLCIVIFAAGLAGLLRQTAVAGEVDDFIESIEQASRSVSSFKSDFIQEKHLAVFAEPVIFNGRLVVARPDRLRWEFTEPMSSVLILNGDEGLRCSGEEAEVRFNLRGDPVMRGVAEQLWLWFSGDYNKLKSLYSLQKKGEDTLVVSALSNSVNQHIEAVTIQFESTTRQPKIVEIHEPGDDFTRIEFTTYARNPTLPDSIFSKCSVDE